MAIHSHVASDMLAKTKACRNGSNEGCKGVAVIALQSSFGCDELKPAVGQQRQRTTILWPSPKEGCTVLNMCELVSQTSQLAHATSRTLLTQEDKVTFFAKEKNSKMLDPIPGCAGTSSLQIYYHNILKEKQPQRR